MKAVIPTEQIERAILFIRGQKVMLDHGLAELYGVRTKVLNQAVKRHRKRFPGDFMFQLSFQEVVSLRSQIVTLKQGQNVKYRPYAFTEHGILMLSSVLNSERAIQVNIEIMRAFVRLRAAMATNRELAQKLGELERRIAGHDEEIRNIFAAIRQLIPAALRIDAAPLLPA